ncbi:MAG TPA: GIY-YIG nuclease family protein, partial [Anaerolineae bacterium]|nr:GIY-YIG nuclease family protein [Anaerolineae bacterium]
MTIYVLRHSDDDIWKIGYTNGDASARLKQLQTGNPDKLELYAEFPGDVPLEKAIHEHLTLCHTTGGSEWFVASQDEIDEVIQTYKFKWASEPIGKTNVACRDCYYLRSSTDNRGHEVHTCGILWDRTWSALHGAMVTTNQQSIEKARSRIGECGPNGKLHKNAWEEREKQERLQREEMRRQAKLRAEQIRMNLKDGLVIGAAVVSLFAFVMLSSALY